MPVFSLTEKLFYYLPFTQLSLWHRITVDYRAELERIIVSEYLRGILKGIKRLFLSLHSTTPHTHTSSPAQSARPPPHLTQTPHTPPH